MEDTNCLDRLLAGFRGFKAIYYEQRPERVRTLVEEGQHPSVLVIACSDSRVDPAIITHAEPGELFVVRNVANLVPPYEPDNSHHSTSAALEFAVRDLGVSEIVVLGHSHCIGVRAMLDKGGEGQTNREFIASWVSIAAEAARDQAAADESDREAAGGRAALRVSIKNLLSFPWVKHGVDAGTLGVSGWWFDMQAGQLHGIREPDAPFQLLT